MSQFIPAQEKYYFVIWLKLIERYNKSIETRLVMAFRNEGLV
jgi:hypothetical protein